MYNKQSWSTHNTIALSISMLLLFLVVISVYKKQTKIGKHNNASKGYESIRNYK